MFGIISTDQKFRNQLPISVVRKIDALIPKTHLLTIGEDFETLPQSRYIYKPAYSSHGDGITANADEAYSTVRDQGIVQVAQEAIPPTAPKLISVSKNDNGFNLKSAFADLNIYLYNDGLNGRRTGLMVARYKDSHPINVAQGGGCGTGYVI